MQGLSTTSKQLLIKIYSNSLLRVKNNVEILSQNLHLTEDYVRELCSSMKKDGLISESNGDFRLTDMGRSKFEVVFTGGVFDIIHPGHVFTLSSAKRLGDVLVVVVARDKTALRNKGHKPLNDETQRLELVQALKFVDASILGSEGDIFETVMKVIPDIIALGYDQKYDESELEREAKRRGLSLKFIRLGTKMPDIKSSKIIEGNKDIMKDF
ncbi:MAG: FAD synthase [Candidatus Methylarchaceae archaeon HK01B]|nr:FAD synthase [Candidatus Methylarchaceae archaeon HK02M1]MCP8318431.1 FAD synthase [Candidatus Methylarchaceae archaeon HK01B]